MKNSHKIFCNANMLKALGNPKRLQVAYLLKSGEKKVGVLEELLQISQSALSQHLAVLRAANLVATRRVAQSVYYSLKDSNCRKLLEAIEKIYA